ncbi:MAG: IS630 transposase-related protein [Alphaproteobacteria bacterium]
MYSKDFRKKVIETYQTGDYSYRDLCDKFEVSLKFVSQLIQHFKNTGEIIKTRIKRKSTYKLNGIYEVNLIDLIKENPSITLNEISDYFKDSHNLSVGKSSIDRKLKSMKITYKKSTTTIPKRIV